MPTISFVQSIYMILWEQEFWKSDNLKAKVIFVYFVTLMDSFKEEA